MDITITVTDKQGALLGDDPAKALKKLALDSIRPLELRETRRKEKALLQAVEALGSNATKAQLLAKTDELEAATLAAEELKRNPPPRERPVR